MTAQWPKRRSQYRLLHRYTALTALKLSHMTPARKWVLDDLNVAYPRDG
jgi:hypothetical protein